MTQTDNGKARDLEAEAEPQPEPVAEENGEAGVEDNGQQQELETEAEAEGEPSELQQELEAEIGAVEGEAAAEAEPPASRPPTSSLSLAINTLLEEQTKTHDRLLRTAAEFENFKKRSRRDRAERIKQAEDHIVLEFLPVVDNLERALSHGGGDEDGALVDGVKMVHKQFLSVLERYGITPFDTVGQPFDPEFHEAVQQMHSEVEAGVVCQELQRGYRRQDRLVRAALVVVSKGPAEEPAEAPEDPRDVAETTELRPVEAEQPDRDAGEDPEDNTETVDLQRPVAGGENMEVGGDTEETAEPVMAEDADGGVQSGEPEAKPEGEA
jgi:molecular chaperone GrpE